METTGQAPTGRRGRRVLRDLWLRQVRRCARVPPPRSGDEAVCARPGGSDAVVRGGAGRSEEVRPALLELSRGGGSRGHRSSAPVKAPPSVLKAPPPGFEPGLLD